MKRAFVHFALFALALAAVVLTAAPAAALLTQTELARVGLHPGPGARIPENLLFTSPPCISGGRKSRGSSMTKPGRVSPRS